MEFTYYIINEKLPRIHSFFIVRNNLIIDASKDILTVCVGKSPGVFLDQLCVWGKDIKVNSIHLVGLTDIQDFLYILEEKLNKYIPKKREKTYVKLLYPDGHFGYIEYDGSEEDRFRIIKEHTELFGRFENKFKKVFKEIGKTKKTNTFEFKL